WSHLDEAYAVKWENYLLVHVRRPTSYEGIGNGLAVEWTDCEKGTAWDGTLLLREYNRGRRPGEDIYKISPWPGEFKDNKGRIQACIPATDRNRDGLHELSKRMDALREAFAKMLEP